MDKSLEFYNNYIIKPIKEKRDKLERLAYSNKPHHLIFRSIYKKQLYRYDDLLLEKYHKMEKYL